LTIDQYFAKLRTNRCRHVFKYGSHTYRVKHSARRAVQQRLSVWQIY